ncbi:MAG: cache domain-containing protein [Chloroflexota bacterium]
MLAKERPTLSIRYALPILFALLILITAVTISLLAFSSGQIVVRNLVTQLSDEITARIEQRVLTYVNTPHDILEANAAAFSAGEIDVNDLDKLANLFWHQIEGHDQLAFISYGDERGNFVGVEHVADGYILRIRDINTAPLRQEFRLDSGGQRQELLDSGQYDPRERGWYQTAVTNGDSTWSNVYQVASRPILAISPVQPVMNPDGEHVGVIAGVLTLTQISDFLRGLTIGETGEAFIMERNGNIIASSVDESPFITDENGEQGRLLAVDSSNDVIEDTAQEIAVRFSASEQPIINAQFQYRDAENGIHYVHANALNDGRGLDWIVVVTIPAADFTGPISERIVHTIQIAILAVVVSVGIGVATARWIIRPILAISEAAASVEDETYEVDGLAVVEQRQDEMGRLARVFKHMIEEVKKREEKLKQQVRKLKIEIDQAKSSQRVKEIVESDFFKALEANSTSMRQRRQQRRATKEKNGRIG